MLHESEEDGVEGILSLYDTPFGLSTYLAVDAASYDIRLRSTEIKMFSDNVCRLYSCFVVASLLQYQFMYVDVELLRCYSTNSLPRSRCFQIMLLYQLLQYIMSVFICLYSTNSPVCRCCNMGTSAKYPQ